MQSCRKCRLPGNKDNLRTRTRPPRHYSLILSLTPIFLKPLFRDFIRKSTVEGPYSAEQSRKRGGSSPWQARYWRQTFLKATEEAREKVDGLFTNQLSRTHAYHGWRCFQRHFLAGKDKPSGGALHASGPCHRHCHCQSATSHPPLFLAVSGEIKKADGPDMSFCVLGRCGGVSGSVPPRGRLRVDEMQM